MFPISFDGPIWSDLIPGVTAVSAVATNSVLAVTGIITITAIVLFPNVTIVSVVAINNVPTVTNIAVITAITLFPTSLNQIKIKKSI